MANQCHSLKEKRSVVRKLKDRVRSRFHILLSEVAGQDTWQRIVFGFAVVSNDRQSVEARLSDIVRFVDGVAIAEILSNEREILSYGEGSLGEFSTDIAAVDRVDGTEHDADDDWIPSSWKSEETP